MELKWVYLHDLWPGGVPMPSDWFKICRGYRLQV
ncbi:PagK family vesicle-borne virulence factor [Salmonella enterica]|nr:hypothetical protein [Salmonella enterica]EBX5572542.1 hypothetical protein [Salmonella enterica subsp. enterica serovar Kuessel]ECH8836937.1 hypothetical protein [Salmonella enterica subsp. enterica]EDW2260667.1 hypothetical protein [Salmonella enterica subsp. enterica serovar Langford]MIL26941.1 hypothetical protein [Salmonella enterica]